ncbi:hypothetical protein ACFP82_17370 [Cellulomonas gelida]|uniref:hypothetical protein n=1 Tax=Cellulomonas gelida TaxID=1712 RepID=UPI00361E239C
MGQVGTGPGSAAGTSSGSDGGAARTPWRFARERWSQRRFAARQLGELRPYAGRGLVAGTVAVHLVAGLAPVAFMLGTGLALRDLGSDAAVGWLALAAGAFLVQQLVAPVHSCSRAGCSVVSTRRASSGSRRSRCGARHSPGSSGLRSRTG